MINEVIDKEPKRAFQILLSVEKIWRDQVKVCTKQKAYNTKLGFET